MTTTALAAARRTDFALSGVSPSPGLARLALSPHTFILGESRTLATRKRHGVRTARALHGQPHWMASASAAGP